MIASGAPGFSAAMGSQVPSGRQVPMGSQVPTRANTRQVPMGSQVPTRANTRQYPMGSQMHQMPDGSMMGQSPQVSRQMQMATTLRNGGTTGRPGGADSTRVRISSPTTAPQRQAPVNDSTWTNPAYNPGRNDNGYTRYDATVYGSGLEHAKNYADGARIFKSYAAITPGTPGYDHGRGAIGRLASMGVNDYTQATDKQMFEAMDSQMRGAQTKNQRPKRGVNLGNIAGLIASYAGNVIGGPVGGYAAGKLVGKAAGARKLR